MKEEISVTNLQNKILRKYVRESILIEALSDLAKYEKTAYIADEQDYSKSVKDTWRRLSDSLDSAWQFISAPFKLLFDLGSIGLAGLNSLFSPDEANYQKIIDERLAKIEAKRAERIIHS